MTVEMAILNTEIKKELIINYESPWRINSSDGHQTEFIRLPRTCLYK